eukprot:74596-Amorphochlora_amoeboformis.AAC.1
MSRRSSSPLSFPPLQALNRPQSRNSVISIELNPDGVHDTSETAARGRRKVTRTAACTIGGRDCGGTLRQQKGQGWDAASNGGPRPDFGLWNPLGALRPNSSACSCVYLPSASIVRRGDGFERVFPRCIRMLKHLAPRVLSNPEKLLVSGVDNHRVAGAGYKIFPSLLLCEPSSISARKSLEHTFQNPNIRAKIILESTPSSLTLIYSFIYLEYIRNASATCSSAYTLKFRAGFSSLQPMACYIHCKTSRRVLRFV